MRGQTGFKRGMVVGGRFQLEELLGQGGMGEVWAAEHQRLGRRVAIKFLLDPEHRSARVRFAREARAAIGHPNVVQVLDIDETGEQPFLVMELLHGETLRAKLRRSGALPFEEAMSVIVPIVSAVGEAHAHGILHRDIKPDNIFLARSEGSAVTVKVLDFGLAKFLTPSAAEDRDHTIALDTMGTPGYAAPEQIRNRGVGLPADVWAMGVLVYECLMGAPPFGRGDMLSYASACEKAGERDWAELGELPEEARRVIVRMLAMNPTERPRLTEVFDTLKGYSSVGAPRFPAPMSAARVVHEVGPIEQAITTGAAFHSSDEVSPIALRALPFIPHNLPPMRFFVGRREELAAIDEALRVEGHSSITQASIFGLGGVGKTALALHYAHSAVKQRQYPGGVYWLNAEGEPSDALVRLAPILRHHAPEHVRRHIPLDVPNVDDLAELVRVALGRVEEQTLLILDNVSQAGWREKIPATEAVRILTTTRDKRYALGRSTALGTLSSAEARMLAVTIAGAPRSDEDAAAMERVIVDELGGLAVAVEMAARAVAEWMESWADYERHLHTEAERLLSDPELQGDYARGVFAAIDLSIERCPYDSPEWRLLESVAVAAPPDIPLTWSTVMAGLTPESVEALRARAVVKGLGLLVVGEGNKVGRIHRLIHARLRARVGKAWAEAQRAEDGSFTEPPAGSKAWFKLGHKIRAVRARGYPPAPPSQPPEPPPPEPMSEEELSKIPFVGVPEREYPAPILASYTSLSSDLARDALCVTALIRDHLLRRYGHSGVVPDREWRMVERALRQRADARLFRRRSVGGSEIAEGVLDVRRRAIGWLLGAPPANSAQSSPLDAAIEELERYALIEVTSPERVSIRGDVVREVLQIVESRPGFITRCADRMAATFRDVDRLLDAVLKHGINRIIADVYIGAKLDPEAPQAFLEGLSRALVAAAEAGAAKAESSPFPDADEDEADADKRGQLIAGLYDKALDLELHELRSLVGEKLDRLRVLRRINRLLTPPRRTLKSPSGPIRCLAITALAQSAVTGSDDGSIHVWALHTGQVRGTLRGHSGAVRSVAVTAWERLVVSASDDGTVRVWSLFMRGEPVCVLCQHSAPITSVAVTPDARLVVAGSADGYVFVWELSTRERLFSGRIPGAPAGDVSNVVVSPDGQTMVASVGDTVYIIDPMTGEVKRALVHKSEIARVESAALGGALITITMDGAASLWDAETWTLVRPIGSSLDVAQVAATPTCKYAFIARDDYVIELRDLVKDESVLAFEGHATSITGLSSTPYGNFAVSSSLDGTLKIWEAVGASPEEYKKYELDYGSRLRYSLYLGSDSPRRSSGFDYFLGLPYGSSYNVSCGAISADGRAAITAYRNDCTLTLWDAQRGRPLGALVGHSGPPARVTLASDGRLAASMTDEEALLWDVRDHELIGKVRVDNAFDFAVSSPKTLIVSARNIVPAQREPTFSVIAHDLSGSTAPRVLLTSEEQIRVASDNNLILMVEPCAIVLWDLASDQLIWRIQKKDQWSVDSISIGGGRAALWGPTHAIIIDVRTGAIVKLLSAKDYPRLPSEGGPLLDERFKTGEAHVEGLTLDQFILQSMPPRYGYAVSVAGRRLLAAYGVVQFLTWNFTEPNP